MQKSMLTVGMMMLISYASCSDEPPYILGCLTLPLFIARKLVEPWKLKKVRQERMAIAYYPAANA